MTQRIAIMAAVDLKDRKARIKELLETVSPEAIEYTVKIRQGVPYMELLAVVKDQQPDMLVVGAKGRSNLADAVVGSTARKMYRRSPIPLVTIPAAFSDIPV
jgi:nucleotide-binding universal stress UspA family protein